MKKIKKKRKKKYLIIKQNMKNRIDTYVTKLQIAYCSDINERKI